jgi:hypothetical protein
VLGILLVMAVVAVILTVIADWIEAVLLGGWTDTAQAKNNSTGA